MSKTHFEALAAIVREKAEGGAFESDTSAASFAEALADFCEDRSPNFQRMRFLRACGTHD